MENPECVYPSDLTDEEWKLIDPIIPKARQPGRPEKYSKRSILNAIFYLVRSGCAWRMLPRDLPPWKLVWHYFAHWKKLGVWAQLNDALRDAVRLLLDALRERFGWLRCIWADGGYAGTLVAWVRALRPRRGTRLEIVKHGTKLHHFQLLPRRWVVERTFAWLGRSRRLSKDYEHTVSSAEAFIYLAMIRLMLRRLAR